MRELDARTAVMRYLEAVEGHDREGALALLADDFELSFAGGGSMGMEALSTAMGWDVGTEGRLRWEVVSADGPVVVVEGEETNDFLRLLELGPWPFRSRFTVGEDGRIVRQEYRVDQRGPSVRERLGPVLDWAREHAPGELEGIHSEEGGLVYTEKAGRRWVALLERWREDGSGPRDRSERRG